MRLASRAWSATTSARSSAATTSTSRSPARRRPWAPTACSGWRWRPPRYGVAAEFGRQALTVLTVSDHLLDGSQDMTAEERETTFQGALSLAVAAALAD